MKKYFHEHTQSEASAAWVIAHNLGRKPGVGVWINLDGLQQVAIPLTVEHLNDNEVKITWSSARTGGAHLA